MCLNMWFILQILAIETPGNDDRQLDLSSDKPVLMGICLFTNQSTTVHILQNEKFFRGGIFKSGHG